MCKWQFILFLLVWFILLFYINWQLTNIFGEENPMRTTYFRQETGKTVSHKVRVECTVAHSFRRQKRSHTLEMIVYLQWCVPVDVQTLSNQDLAFIWICLRSSLQQIETCNICNKTYQKQLNSEAHQPNWITINYSQITFYNILSFSILLNVMKIPFVPYQIQQINIRID